MLTNLQTEKSLVMSRELLDRRTKNKTFISGFHLVRPHSIFKTSQTVEKLVSLRLRMKNRPHDWTRETLEPLIQKYGLANSQIDARGTEVDDFTKEEDAPLSFFKDGEIPTLDQRMNLYRTQARRAIHELYEKKPMASEHLLHVTCTGYMSPNPAQEIADEWRRNGHGDVTVTNVYHMGCLAALPALRISRGFVHGDPTKSTVDVVHQELCTMHFNPLSLEPEQIVVQSLFADGHIRYSVSDHESQGSYELLALKEIIIPGTSHMMSWNLFPNQFSMHLSREVPVKIRQYLPKLLAQLLEQAGIPSDSNLIFAIHPGGPKIIQACEQVLEISQEQAIESHEVLREYGNMSSATLPHIWDKILRNPERRDGQFVVSFGFGPGLTASGAIFQIHK